MNSSNFSIFVQSKWFGYACYALLAIFIAGFVYNRYIDKRRDYYEMNMSCFAFRDVNWNGFFDMEDRPYAGLKIAMDRPKGKSVTSHSNLNGFTNFKIRLGDRKSKINRPGDYEITIEPPLDWIVTTNNSVQTMRIEELAESPVGLVADRTFSHVGIAPELTISGKIALESLSPEDSIASLFAVNPNGDTDIIQLMDTGEFNIEAFSGEWKLALATKKGATASRELTVKHYPVVVSQINLGLSNSASGDEDLIVGFDDVTTSDTLYEVPNGYAGLNWNNWVATHRLFYEKKSHANATVSSEYMAYTSSGHPSAIGSETPFDFVGGYLSMSQPEGEEHDIAVRAWNGDKLLYENRFRASEKGPIFFDARYKGITKLQFVNEAYWHIVIDDFQFRTE